VRPQANGAVGAKELAGELMQRALEVGQRDAAVDRQSFDLVEHGRVGGVEVGPVDLAGADDVDGRLLRFHGAHLDRRGLGAQQQVADHGRAGGGVTAGAAGGAYGGSARGTRARVTGGASDRRALVDEERIVDRARGVVVGRVESREVVVVELDLGALGDLVSHPQKDVFDLADGATDQVPVTARQGHAGQRDVEALGGQRRGQRGAAQLVLAGRDETLELDTHDVAQLTDHRSFGRRQ